MNKQIKTWAPKLALLLQSEFPCTADYTGRHAEAERERERERDKKGQRSRERERECMYSSVM